MTRRIRAYLPYVFVVGFATWCLYRIRGDLAQLSLARLAHSWDLVLLAVLLSLLSYALRIARWQAYLKQLGHHVTLRFAALTFTAGFAYTLSPGKVGELVRARYYQPLGIPLRSITAAFFVERLMDLVAMVVLATLLFTASSLYTGAVLTAGVLVLTVLLCLAVLPWDRLAGALTSCPRLPPVLRRAASGLASSLAATRILLRPQALVAGFTLGLLAWGLEGTGLGWLSAMFAPAHLGLASAWGIYGVAVLLGSLSFLPGGLGGTEAVMTALLHAHGFPVSDALLLTLTCRFVTLWFAVVLGWLAVFALRPRAPGALLPWR